MSDTIDNGYAVLDDGETLKLNRLLPGPIERVWAYLTQSELRRKWLAQGEMEMKEGSPFELVWRNSELTDPPGTPPEGMTGEHTMASRITELDAPHRLSFTWSNTGEVTFELAKEGDMVRLNLTHRRVPAGRMRKMIGAGWHAHTNVLAAELAGAPPAPFWDAFRSLERDYAARLGE